VCLPSQMCSPEGSRHGTDSIRHFIRHQTENVGGSAGTTQRSRRDAENRKVRHGRKPGKQLPGLFPSALSFTLALDRLHTTQHAVWTSPSLLNTTKSKSRGKTGKARPLKCTGTHTHDRVDRMFDEKQVSKHNTVHLTIPRQGHPNETHGETL
jgi:hypothetical protein